LSVKTNYGQNAQFADDSSDKVVIKDACVFDCCWFVQHLLHFGKT